MNQFTGGPQPLVLQDFCDKRLPESKGRKRIGDLLSKADLEEYLADLFLAPHLLYIS
jgi:hypothetical protein